MKTLADYIAIMLGECMPWDNTIECYTYCDRQPRQCCRMTKISIDMIRKGDY